MDDKLICLICHNPFDHLGSHIAKGHKITAREYKQQFGLDYKFALISESVKKKKQQAFEEDREYYLSNLLKHGKKYQFKKGHTGTHRVSQQSYERYIAQGLQALSNAKGICVVCKMGFDHIDSHLYNKHRLQRVK